MKILISLNPFDRAIHLTITDISVTDKQFFEIAQIADNTLQQNIENYLKFSKILTKEGETND